MYCMHILLFTLFVPSSHKLVPLNMQIYTYSYYLLGLLIAVPCILHFVHLDPDILVTKVLNSRAFHSCQNGLLYTLYYWCWASVCFTSFVVLCFQFILRLYNNSICVYVCIWMLYSWKYYYNMIFQSLILKNFNNLLINKSSSIKILHFKDVFCLSCKIIFTLENLLQKLYDQVVCYSHLHQMFCTGFHFSCVWGWLWVWWQVHWPQCVSLQRWKCWTILSRVSWPLVFLLQLLW